MVATTRRQFLRASLALAAALPLGAAVTALADSGPPRRDDWEADPVTEGPALAFRAILPPAQLTDTPPPAVTARYVAIVDEASGQVLHGQDPHARSGPASTTKIATALVTLEQWGADRLDEQVPISVDGAAMAARGSTVMGLQPGDELTMRTLLYGLMLPSGNDAAEQLALTVGGERQQFVDWMNAKVASLGLGDTHFVNPHGLDNWLHYSSAYDLVMLARQGMLRRDSTFRDLAGAQTYKGEGYTFTNLNRLLPIYPGADGVKIGYTPKAGKTMVASATRDGHRVYVGLLRSDDLPGDSVALLDWAWSTFRWA